MSDSTDGDTSAVKVVIRSRPLMGYELTSNAQTVVEYLPSNQISIGGVNGSKKKTFTFDHVFNEQSTQSYVYSTCCKSLVQSYMNGYNATILAYGQTGSGKTHTMGTAASTSPNSSTFPIISENDGIVPRVIRDIFSIIESRKLTHEYTVEVSFLEIHNEDLNDLLADPTSSSHLNKKELSIRETPSGDIQVMGAMKIAVGSYQEMMNSLEKGAANRSVGSTNMNQHSSRSHSIFSVYLTQHRLAFTNTNTSIITTDDLNTTTVSTSAPSTPTSSSISGIDISSDSFDLEAGETICSKFHFVDLAGSERLKRTGAVGQRMKEGISINCGLLALGNVISALADNTRNRGHIPFRNSKITRLLQDSLGGNSQTMMIACISPADVNEEESVNTLMYANRAKNIRNKPVLNRDPVAIKMGELRKRILILEKLLKDNNIPIPADTTSFNTSTNIPGMGSHISGFLGNDQSIRGVDGGEENNSQLQWEYKELKNRYSQLECSYHDAMGREAVTLSQLAIMKQQNAQLNDKLQEYDRVCSEGEMINQMLMKRISSSVDALGTIAKELNKYTFIVDTPVSIANVSNEAIKPSENGMNDHSKSNDHPNSNTVTTSTATSSSNATIDEQTRLSLSTIHSNIEQLMITLKKTLDIPLPTLSFTPSSSPSVSHQDAGIVPPVSDNNRWIAEYARLQMAMATVIAKEHRKKQQRHQKLASIKQIIADYQETRVDEGVKDDSKQKSMDLDDNDIDLGIEVDDHNTGSIDKNTDVSSVAADDENVASLLNDSTAALASVEITAETTTSETTQQIDEVQPNEDMKDNTNHPTEDPFYRLRTQKQTRKSMAALRDILLIVEKVDEDNEDDDVDIDMDLNDFERFRCYLSQPQTAGKRKKSGDNSAYRSRKSQMSSDKNFEKRCRVAMNLFEAKHEMDSLKSRSFNIEQDLENYTDNLKLLVQEREFIYNDHKATERLVREKERELERVIRERDQLLAKYKKGQDVSVHKLEEAKYAKQVKELKEQLANLRTELRRKEKEKVEAENKASMITELQAKITQLKKEKTMVSQQMTEKIATIRGLTKQSTVLQTQLERQKKIMDAKINSLERSMSKKSQANEMKYRHIYKLYQNLKNTNFKRRPVSTRPSSSVSRTTRPSTDSIVARLSTASTCSMPGVPVSFSASTTSSSSSSSASRRGSAPDITNPSFNLSSSISAIPSRYSNGTAGVRRGSVSVGELPPWNSSWSTTSHTFGPAITLRTVNHTVPPGGRPPNSATQAQQADLMKKFDSLKITVDNDGNAYDASVAENVDNLFIENNKEETEDNAANMLESPTKKRKSNVYNPNTGYYNDTKTVTSNGMKNVELTPFTKAFGSYSRVDSTPLVMNLNDVDEKEESSSATPSLYSHLDEDDLITSQLRDKISKQINATVNNDENNTHATATCDLEANFQDLELLLKSIQPSNGGVENSTSSNNVVTGDSTPHRLPLGSSSLSNRALALTNTSTKKFHSNNSHENVNLDMENENMV